ncbi:MAG TPA: hypothetical protein VGQ03_08860 [Nitrososphaera sp.]|nr:hypothetical protein [Nitrososphaera sp.]
MHAGRGTSKAAMLVAIRLFLHPLFPIIDYVTPLAAMLISPMFTIPQYVKSKMQMRPRDKEL